MRKFFEIIFIPGELIEYSIEKFFNKREKKIVKKIIYFRNKFIKE